MKSCPRCGSTYPDAERFCETDGTALVSTAAAGERGTTPISDDTIEPSSGGVIECPECHGKAEPGETICNFCGTQLQPGAGGPSAGQRPQSEPSRPSASPETFIPSRNRIATNEIGGEPVYDDTLEEQPSLRQRIARVLGYSIAAIIAIAAGAWFALHLSSGRTKAPLAQASPVASSAISAPMVALARNMQIAVKGADLAAALQRDKDSVRKVFDINRDTVLDSYKRALQSDNTLHDGMVVRLHVLPDGSVGGGSVLVSTSLNPSLDAEVIKRMSEWKFGSSAGAPVDVDYPLIFATNSGDIGGIEADLNAKFASLGPNETPEYASAPSIAPSPPVAAVTPEAVPALPPAVAALPPPEVPAVRPYRKPRVSAPKAERRPRLSLTDRVTQALAADKRLRRVQAYASSGGMVTITGKVFDDKSKMLAERTVRNVDGVTGLINNLTTDTSVWAQRESRIAQQLQAEGLTGVTVKVIGNSAYLEGTVKNDLDRERAATIAVSAAPVKVRTNLIKVDPGFFGY